MLQFAGVSAAVVMTVAGVLALRSVWAVNGRSRLFVLGGWLALGVATFGWLRVADGDKAVALALLVPSLVAFVAIGAGIDLKRRKAGKVRDAVGVELTGEPARIWRGAVRFLLAGPLSALAAVAVSTLSTTRAPLAEADRLIASGLLAPLIWAICIGWSLSDSRLMRVFSGLAAITLSTGSAIFL